MYGGQNEGTLPQPTVYNDTWAGIWPTTGWQLQCDPCTGIPGLRSTRMVYYPVSNQVVLYGGDTQAGADDSSPNAHNILYAFDENLWTNKTPTTPDRPPALESVGIEFYPYYQTTSQRVDKVIMFGGNQNGGTPYGGTWNLVVDNPGGGTPSYHWEEIKNDTQYQTNCPSSSYGYPDPRGAPGLAFDGKELVLFGGRGQFGTLNDTWYLVLNGTNLCWQRKLGVSRPDPDRAKFRMAFHPFTSTEPYSGEIVLFGGDRGGQTPLLNDTWFFTPTAGWFPCDNADANHPCTPGGTSSPPSKRCCVGLTFGDNLGGTPDGQMVLFGGQTGPSSDSGSFNGETWRWRRSLPNQGWSCLVTCPP